MPVIVTWLADAAVTVKFEDAPALTDPGLADRVTAGSNVPVPLVLPHPAISMGSRSAENQNMYRRNEN